MLLIAAASALGWSLFDLSRRKIGENLAAIPAVISVMILQAAFSMPFGGWSEPLQMDGRWWGLTLVNVLANSTANVLFVLSVQRAPFTLVVPILALIPAFTATFGWIAFGQELAAKQIGAVALIVVAALWQGWYGQDRLPNRREIAGLNLMGVTTVLWGLTPFLDRALTSGNLSGGNPLRLTIYVVVQCLGVAAVLIVASMVLRKGRADLKRALLMWPRGWPWIALAALAASLGLYFQIIGVNAYNVGLFEAVKRSAILLLSLLFGRYWLGEAVSREKVAAAIAMAVGIFLLA